MYTALQFPVWLWHRQTWAKTQHVPWSFFFFFFFFKFSQSSTHSWRAMLFSMLTGGFCRCRNVTVQKCWTVFSLLVNISQGLLDTNLLPLMVVTGMLDSSLPCGEGHVAVGHHSLGCDEGHRLLDMVLSAVVKVMGVLDTILLAVVKVTGVSDTILSTEMKVMGCWTLCS